MNSWSRQQVDQVEIVLIFPFLATISPIILIDFSIVIIPIVPFLSFYLIVTYYSSQSSPISIFSTSIASIFSSNPLFASSTISLSYLSPSLSLFLSLLSLLLSFSCASHDDKTIILSSRLTRLLRLWLLQWNLCYYLQANICSHGLVGNLKSNCSKYQRISIVDSSL